MKPDYPLWCNVFSGQKLSLQRWSGAFISSQLSENPGYCRSYSPLLTFFNTVNPAFLASLTESGFSLIGELKLEMIFRTGFLQAGQLVSGAAESGRRKVNLPPQTLQSPSHNSYS